MDCSSSFVTRTDRGQRMLDSEPFKGVDLVYSGRGGSNAWV